MSNDNNDFDLNQPAVQHAPDVDGMPNLADDRITGSQRFQMWLEKNQSAEHDAQDDAGPSQTQALGNPQSKDVSEPQLKVDDVTQHDEATSSLEQARQEIERLRELNRAKKTAKLQQKDVQQKAVKPSLADPLSLIKQLYPDHEALIEAAARQASTGVVPDDWKKRVEEMSINERFAALENELKSRDEAIKLQQQHEQNKKFITDIAATRAAEFEKTSDKYPLLAAIVKDRGGVDLILEAQRTYYKNTKSQGNPQALDFNKACELLENHYAKEAEYYTKLKSASSKAPQSINKDTSDILTSNNNAESASSSDKRLSPRELAMLKLQRENEDRAKMLSFFKSLKKK